MAKQVDKADPGPEKQVAVKDLPWNDDRSRLVRANKKLARMGLMTITKLP